MAALADYVHGKGLRFGLYTCAGTQTCQQRPGSYGFEEQDAASYASWGVDFVQCSPVTTGTSYSTARAGTAKSSVKTRPPSKRNKR